MTWSPPVSKLLAPLENYTRLHGATLRRYGARAIDLAYPNPRFLSDPRPFQVLADIASRCGPIDLRYSPFGGFTAVRRRIASTLTRQQQTPYRWADVILTPGAAAALNVVLSTMFCAPDRVMLISPCWMDYPLYLAHLGLGCDMVTSSPGTFDLEGIEKAWSANTRALIISQPASPTGAVYTHDHLAALSGLLHRLGEKYGQTPILIADEAHRDQMWAASSCPSPGTTYPHTITVHSFGKAWEMQGQRIGYLAVSPRFAPEQHASRRLEQGMRLTGHCAPSAIMQHVAAAMAGTTPDNTTLANLQVHARAELRRLGIEITDAAATRFIYARCPTANDLGFVADLAAQGVLTMPSTLFHEPGHFRLALNVAQAELDRALAIIGTVAASSV